MSALFFVLALLAALLALHPFVTYPLSLRLFAKLRGGSKLDLSGHKPQKITVMISARNEAAVIEDKLLSVQAAAAQTAPTEVEILLFADGCTDDTAAISERVIGAGNVLNGGATAGGKTEAMNALARRATGEVLVLTDANSMLEPGALQALLERFLDPAVGAVLGSSDVDLSGAASNGLSGLLAGYWRFEETLRGLESNLGSAIGGDGALYGVRADLWPFPARDIIDDFFVPMSVLLAGKRVVFAPDAKIREAAVTGLKDEAPRKYRIAVRALRAHRELAPRLKTLDALHLYKYISHKMLKWMMGFSAVAACVFAGLGLAFAGYGALALSAGVIFAGLLGIGAAQPSAPLAGKLYSAAVSIFQVSRGALYGLRGGSITNWTPPVSDRRVVK